MLRQNSVRRAINSAAISLRRSARLIGSPVMHLNCTRRSWRWVELESASR
jgi:hypothetical protein